MGFTVTLKVEHLELPKILVSTPSEQSGKVLVPNVEPYRTVKASVKDFVRRNLFIPEDLQVLQAPLFRKVSEKEHVEDIYKRYACQAEIENPELHLDEDNFVFFAREGGRMVDLDDSRRLEEYHILEKSVLQMRRLPQSLSGNGGRIFVETKDGILPILGVKPSMQVLELKHILEGMTGVAVEQQLLSSVGRSMHDGLYMKDFDGPHRVCEDSTLDLCKSGDSNVEQAHLRMVISVNVMGEQSFTMVVQGRDLVQSVQQVVEVRTGVSTWQQRITYSGKILQEKKTLSEYFIHPDCTLQVTVFRSPCKPSMKRVNNTLHSRENSGIEEQRPAARKIKLLRTSKGHIIGTITIPVLTTDTVSDLKRKVRRTLQPLTERNFVVLRSPVGSGNDSTTSTPSKLVSPSQNDQFSTSGRRLSRVLSFTGRTFSGQLGNGNNNGIPTPKTPVPAVVVHSAATVAPQPDVDTAADNNTPPPLQTSAPAPASLLPDGHHSGKKVARVLSFRNFSGPLVSPSKQMHPLAPAPQPTAAPLFPPPLPSPNGSPPQMNDSVDATTSSTGPDIKATASMRSIGISTGSFRTLPDDSVPPGPPLKFVPMRPNTSSITPNSSSVPITPKSSGLRQQPLTRAQSMGHISFTPAQLHSLPGVYAPAPPAPAPPAAAMEGILPHSTALPVRSNLYCTSPLRPRVKETATGSIGTGERKGLGAWLTGGMQVLKEHIKSPFADR